MKRSLVAPLAIVLGALSLGCSVGEGEGWVRSERLYVEDCVNGRFDLGPDFFGANSFRGDALQIRVQRGEPEILRSVRLAHRRPRIRWSAPLPSSLG